MRSERELTDDQWAALAPHLPPQRARTGRPAKDHRTVVEGVLWRLRTGAPWRDLHEHFGKWGSVYRQFRRWTVAGVWDVILDALNREGGGLDAVQMIDSTVVRAHQHAAGAKKGALRAKVLGVRAVATRPRSI